jgi:hypothetical protein
MIQTCFHRIPRDLYFETHFPRWKKAVMTTVNLDLIPPNRLIVNWWLLSSGLSIGYLIAVNPLYHDPGLQPEERFQLPSANAR